MGKQTSSQPHMAAAETATAFGAWLRRQRESMGLSPDELARRLDPQAPPVESFEAGAQRPTRAQAEALADLFSVPSEQRAAFVLFASTDLDTDDDAPPDAPWVVRVRPPSNLPVQLTSFVGREGEVDRVATMLARPDVRLLTLLGPPGIGKTRLSLEVAHKLLDDAPGEEGAALSRSYEDGVFFVPLAPVTDYALVPSAIASTLNLKLTANQPPMDALRDFLGAKDMLLVLDNFEQIVGAGTAVADLLAVCPNVQVMVSSRVALHVYGEQVYRVPPMLLPGKEVQATAESLAEWEAVDLFLQRVRLVRPDFSLDEQTAPVVAEIVRRLDGLPLAIELAAARARVLTPQGILERLDDRLKLLVGGAENVPARQRTLRSAIDWSYDLLDEEEARLFRRLSVFVGGCSLSHAERMAEDDASGAQAGRDALDLIASLVDKSLLKEESGPGGENRLLMLETLREYGLERLRAAGEEAEMRRRHALLMTDLAEAAEPHLTSAARDPWMARLDADLDNIRAALSWSLSDVGDAGVGLRLAGALGWYWYFRGYFVEGRRWLERAIAQDSEVPSANTRAKAFHVMSVIADAQADDRAAHQWAGEAVQIWRRTSSKTELPFVQTLLGLITVVVGDVDDGYSLIEEGVGQLRQVGDDWRLALGLERLGDAQFRRSDFGGSANSYHEGMALFERLGDLWGQSIGQYALGGLALTLKRYDEALEHFENALQIETRVGNRLARTYLLGSLGMVSFMKMDYDKAAAHFQVVLSYFREVCAPRYVLIMVRYLGYAAILQAKYSWAADLYMEYLSVVKAHGTDSDLVHGMNAIASLSAAIRQPELSAKLLAFAEARRLTANVVMRDLDASQLESTLKLATRLLPNDTWRQLSRSGESLSKDEALDIALTVCTMAKQTADEVIIATAAKNVRRSKEPGPNILSNREIELLSLLTIGLSNAEIAARLFLSPNTVRAHLYSIYNKIDVTSRTAAAHYARTHNFA